jgi:hypothetical protein
MAVVKADEGRCLHSAEVRDSAPPVALRRVPWTCRWGVFGGPVRVSEAVEHGYVFWTCSHPDHSSPRLLSPGECASCAHWEPAAAV